MATAVLRWPNISYQLQSVRRTAWTGQPAGAVLHAQPLRARARAPPPPAPPPPPPPPTQHSASVLTLPACLRRCPAGRDASAQRLPGRHALRRRSHAARLPRRRRHARRRHQGAQAHPPQPLAQTTNERGASTREPGPRGSGSEPPTPGSPLLSPPPQTLCPPPSTSPPPPPSSHTSPAPLSPAPTPITGRKLRGSGGGSISTRSGAAARRSLLADGAGACPADTQGVCRSASHIISSSIAECTSEGGR